MDRPSVEMKRVAIECAPDDASQVPTGDTSDELLRPYRPIAASEVLHRAREMSRELFLASTGNFGFTAPPSVPDDLPGVRLTPEAPGTRLSEEALERVKDHADHFAYWALYESRFPDEASCVCAEEEAVAVLLSMLPYSRSPAVYAALQVLQALVVNPQTARFLGRVPVQLLVDAEECAVLSKDNDHEAEGHGAPQSADAHGKVWVGSDLCQLLFAAARKFPNKADLQVAIVTVARHVAPLIIERYLTADLVSSVLAAMKAHPTSIEVQREAALLFAETVSVPRADPMDAPVALLYVHVGNIVEYLLAAVQTMPTSSDVAHAAVTTLLVMARRVENDDELAGTRALHVLTRIVQQHRKNIDLVSDTLATAACMSRWMDDTQRRGFCITLRDLMMETTEPAILASCCAVLHVTLNQYEQEILALTSPQMAEQRLQQQGTTMEAVMAGLHDEAAARYDALQALRSFCAAQKVPQLIHIGLEHFGDDSDALVETARLALSSLVLKRMPTAARVEHERKLLMRAESLAAAAAATQAGVADDDDDDDDDDVSAAASHADPNAGTP